MNKFVARYTDGRIVKGTTLDFAPSRETIHLTESGAEYALYPTEVKLAELKALFYVKTFEGDPDHVDRRVFDTPPGLDERWVEITFKDGEVMLGTTTTYRVAGPGFFVTPGDATCNNTRCFVLDDAVESLRYV